MNRPIRIPSPQRCEAFSPGRSGVSSPWPGPIARSCEGCSGRDARATSKSHGKQRRGAALVEFAVCLPVIMIVLLGSMEACSAIFVRQALTCSAYEGIRAAVKGGAVTSESVARAQAVLDTRGIKNSTIRFEPADVRDADRGTDIVIEVSAPYAVNSPFFGHVIADRVTTVRTVMSKE